jgi:hypothetical protein
MLETSRIQPIGCLFQMAERDFEISVDCKMQITPTARASVAANDSANVQSICSIELSWNWVPAVF